MTLSIISPLVKTIILVAALFLTVNFAHAAGDEANQSSFDQSQLQAEQDQLRTEIHHHPRHGWGHRPHYPHPRPYYPPPVPIWPLPIIPLPQIAPQWGWTCYTQVTACGLPNAAQVGTSCWCPSYYGQVWGNVGF